MANKTGKGGFGDHKEHIWRKGTPENFNEFRTLAIAIAKEKALKGNQPIVVNGHAATIAEIIIRQWFLSGDFKKQLAAFQYAYGKVPDRQELTGAEGGAITVKVLKNVSTDDL